jgi:RNase P subunit RPR2
LNVCGFFVASAPGHYIESVFVVAPGKARGELLVTLTCPECGNDRNFQVKTLQMHVVHLEDGRVEVSDESRPAVLEVLCDECESPLKFEEFEDTLRKEVLLTIGAR